MYAAQAFANSGDISGFLEMMFAAMRSAFDLGYPRLAQPYKCRTLCPIPCGRHKLACEYVAALCDTLQGAYLHKKLSQGGIN
jgi:hypothetical protein